MSVKDKTAKMLYIDNITAETLKQIAKVYKCSESTIMRKALTNYFSLYEDVIKPMKEQASLFKK